MAIFFVNKSDLQKHPGFQEEAVPFCKSINDNELCFLFEPKPGFLASFGVLLTEQGISYQLEFDLGKIKW
jgi:hypothetical protein